MRPALLASHLRCRSGAGPNLSGTIRRRAAPRNAIIAGLDAHTDAEMALAHCRSLLDVQAFNEGLM
jgi:hypothetical protein